ncbi:MAG: respiratory nitrate reductase subunit gamma [Nitrososphaerota archaeon]
MSTPVLTRDVIPVSVVDMLALISVIIIAAGVVYKLLEWRRIIPRGFMSEVRARLGYGGVGSTLTREVVDRVVANRGLFNEGWRRAIHLTMFWGFVGLAVTTTWAYIVNPHADYRPISEPYRILGNVSGVLLLFGSTVAILRILFSSRFRHARTVKDLLFLCSLWLTTVTGFTTQYYREIAQTSPVNPSIATLLAFNYQLHFILVGTLLLTAPFTSFMHAITTPLLRLYENLGNRLVPQLNLRGIKTSADVSFIQRIYEEQHILSLVQNTSNPAGVETGAEKAEDRDVQFFERIYRHD